MRVAAALLCVTLLGTSVGGARISLDVHGAALADVLTMLSEESGISVVADDSVKPTRVTLHLQNVTFDEALTVLTQANDLQVRRSGRVLIVGSADAMNRRYDGGDALGARTAILRLAHAAPDDVAKELGVALPPGAVIVPDKRTNSVVISADRETIARARELVTALDAPQSGTSEVPTSEVYPLKYARADEAIKLLKVIVPTASVAADEDRNALVVAGDESTQGAVRAFLAKVDVAAAQVLFEVRVADVQPQNDSSDVGLEFGGQDLQGQPLPGAATYAFSGRTIQINTRLNAMIAQGRAQVLATPKLLTLDNKEADLLIGETYPIAYQTSAFSGQEVQFVDIGVKLRLTPRIGPEGSVTAELHPEYSEVEGFAGNGLPIIANRKIDSTLRVKDGQTIVLGGLMRDVTSETITRIPGLSQIPILGKFFQDKQTTHQRNEIVFLITPHVIYPNDVPPQK